MLKIFLKDCVFINLIMKNIQSQHMRLNIFGGRSDLILEFGALHVSCMKIYTNKVPFPYVLGFNFIRYCNTVFYPELFRYLGNNRLLHTTI